MAVAEQASEQEATAEVAAKDWAATLEAWLAKLRAEPGHDDRVYTSFNLAQDFYDASVDEALQQKVVGELLRAFTEFELAPREERLPVLEWEVLARARLAGCPSLTFDFERRWEVRSGLMAASDLLTHHPDLPSQSYAGAALIGAARASCQLDIDLGRLEQATLTLHRLRQSSLNLGEDPYIRLLQLEVNFADRLFDYIRPLSLEGSEDDPYLAQIVLRSQSLEIQARLRAALDRGLAGTPLPATARQDLCQEARSFSDGPDLPPLQAARIRLGIAGLEGASGDCSAAASTIALLGEAAPVPGLLGELLALETDLLLAQMLRSGCEQVEQTPELLDGRVLERWERIFEAWQNAPRLEGGIGFLQTYGRRQLFLEALLTTLRSKGDAEAFELVSEVQAQGGLEQRSNADSVDLEECLGALEGSGVGVLCFVPGDRETLICALSESGVRWFSTASPFELRSRAQDLGQLLRRPQRENRERADELARELGDAFWTEEIVTWVESIDHLVLVGSEHLGWLEPEALFLGGERPLGLSLPISRVSSVGLFLQLDGAARGAEPEGDLDELIVAATGVEADPTRWRSLEPLPDVDWDSFGGAQLDGRRVLEHKAARLGNVRSKLAQPTDLLTLLAHGLRDTSRLLPAGVLLTDGTGRGVEVWTEDLRALRAPQLCALLVCRAAEGQARLGDGETAHVAGALLEAGAHSVLCSARDLEMDFALAAYSRWREELLAGASPSQALLAAKRASVEELGMAFAASSLTLLGAGTAGLP